MTVLTQQPCLPGFDRPALVDAGPAGGDPNAGSRAAADAGVPVLPGQLALFTAEREMLGLMSDAIGRGRFEEALELREALIAREGPSNGTREVALLDQFGVPTFWSRSPGEILRDWLMLDRDPSAGAGVRALLSSGLFVRLLETHEPAALVREEPAVLGPLVNFLSTVDSDADPDPAALLRDALLAGHTSAPNDFDDPAFVDLLAENRGPAWLAGIGAMRRLWVVPPSDAAELALSLSSVPDDDEERGRQFWACLRRAMACGRDDPAAVEARKRMKQLDAELHAQFMRQGLRRE
jgi:hypothetical protein